MSANTATGHGFSNTIAERNDRISRDELIPHNRIMVIFQHIEDNSIMELTFPIDAIGKMNMAISRYTLDNKKTKHKKAEHRLIELFTFYHSQ